MVALDPLLHSKGIAGDTKERPIVSLTQLIDIRSEEQGDQTALFALEPGSDELHSLTYAQLRKAVDRLAWQWHHLRLPADHHADQPQADGATSGSVDTPAKEVTVAIFFHSSLNLTLTEFALHRLGCAALLISPNNPASAVAGLLKATKCQTILAGARLLDTAQEAAEMLAKDSNFELNVHEEIVLPLFGSDGIANTKVSPYPSRFRYPEETGRQCIILHSSGSTGFPKPLPGTHKTVLANAASNFGTTAATVLPLFHGFGHHASLRCIAAGKPLFVYPPHLPTTASNIVQFLRVSQEQSGIQIDQLFSVAYILKLLSENEEAINALLQFKVVSFAGSALPDEVGDKLTQRGVRLLSQYGTTETGTVMTSMRHFRDDKGWNWLRVTKPAQDFLVMEPRGEGVFEAVVKKGFGSLAVVNRADGFATKDLFLRHPDHPEQYKYCGRADDTLTQTLGEKTNPVPIELTIRGSSEYVAEAIVFGDGRPQIGCLILPSEACAGMSSEDIKKSIIPAVEVANAAAPTHSRIVPELVEILPIGTYVPIATKGSILRPACYVAFKDLIDGVYERYESAQDTSKLSLQGKELEMHLKDIIAQVIGPKKAECLESETDLFNFGIDSLQSARIRLLVMRSINLNGYSLSQNVIYENPSIQKLARHVDSVASGATGMTAENRNEAAHQVMWDLVKKYTVNLEHHAAGLKSPSSASAQSQTRHVVVLTGATGALGAHLLSQMLAMPTIHRVYALVRAESDGSALRRVKKAFVERKLALVQEDKLACLASRLGGEKLGLEEAVYDQIAASATAVIHNAWSVNFNLSVESFEAENVRAAYNLLNLCLRSPHDRPASFYFSSSVSTRQGRWSPDSVAEVITDDPSYAVPTGYGRSKWVTEQICKVASRERGVHCGVLRIGQMAGDTVNGVWNTTEAIPLMLRTAQSLGAVPDIKDCPSYLPYDIAARGILEILQVGDRGPQASLYHIVNPSNSVSFEQIYDFMEKDAGVKGFQRVTPKEWVRLLEASSPNPEGNPIYKLLDFFKNRFGGDAINPQMKFDITETAKVAPSIGDCPPITPELVKRWITSWRQVGFFE